MSYIGKADIGLDRYSFGSTLYGICDTAIGLNAKEVALTDFDRFFNGITIYVKFNRGNNVASNVTLKVGSTSALPVVGICTCRIGEILAFTYEENASSGDCWRTHTCGDVVSHSELDAAIAAMPQAMVFRGIFNDLPDSIASYTNYNGGDMIIVGKKEYMYKKGNSASATESYWIEMGDEDSYALESNHTNINTVGTWTDATVDNGILVLPSLSTNTVNVIIPRT